MATLNSPRPDWLKQTIANPETATEDDLRSALRLAKAMLPLLLDGRNVTGVSLTTSGVGSGRRSQVKLTPDLRDRLALDITRMELEIARRLAARKRGRR